ncbi:MAG TPA: hypothetical protein VGE45_01005 [Chloroflexia bacterium]|jgi:hypothetical protein
MAVDVNEYIPNVIHNQESDLTGYTLLAAGGLLRELAVLDQKQVAEIEETLDFYAIHGNAREWWSELSRLVRYRNESIKRISRKKVKP